MLSTPNGLGPVVEDSDYLDPPSNAPEHPWEFRPGEAARELDPGMGLAVARRTVFRPADREDWGRVAKRVALGNTLLTPTWPHERRALASAIARGALLTSGRHLQHGDKNQPNRNQEVVTNCSSSSSSFLMHYLLLNGSGVGRSYDDDMMLVDWQYAPDLVLVLSPRHKDAVEGWESQLGEIPPNVLILPESPSDLSDCRILVVEDSREGWAKALELWESMAFARTLNEFCPSTLLLDWSDVRPEGSPIGGMQDRPSSGPISPMRAFVNVARDVVWASQQAPMPRWKQAMILDHYFSQEVQVGGARRAARMSTKTWRDPGILEFARIKSEGGLWTSNNSIMVDAEFWREAGIPGTRAQEIFFQASQLAFKNGEPGWINGDKLEDTAKELTRKFPVQAPEGSKKYSITYGKALVEATNQASEQLQFPNVTNPCGEIVLHTTGGFCVLCSFAPLLACPEDLTKLEPGKAPRFIQHNWDTRVRDSVALGVRFLIRVNLMDSIYKEEVARTNRIGLCPTGLHEWAWMRFGLSFRDLLDPQVSYAFWESLRELSTLAKLEAKRYSEELGLSNPFTAVAAKPDGTAGKLFGLTEGVHLPARRGYLRWVQYRNDDPLVGELATQGYPTRKLVTFPGMTIVGFPTRPLITRLGMGEKLVTAPEATPEEQYQWLRLLERYWLGEDQGNQISYCLASREHLIPTTLGLRRIEATENMEGEYGSVCDRTGAHNQILENVWNGIKPTISITLENGTSIRGTVEHKILCVDRNLDFVWKQLGEIVEGDIAVRRLGGPQAYENAQLPKLPNVCPRQGCVNLKVPHSVTPGFSEFLGMLMADGCIYENGVSFITADGEIEALFSLHLENNFGLIPGKGKDKRGKNLLKVDGSSRNLRRWLEYLGVARDHNYNKIPNCVLHSTPECQRKFIAGYTLDGYATNHGYAYICSTTSQQMATDVAVMLMSLGYDARIGWKAGKPYWFSDTNNGMGRDQWQTYLGKEDSIRFVQEIGFLESRKNASILKATRSERLSMGHKSNSIWADKFLEWFRENRFHLSKSDRKLYDCLRASSERISIQVVRKSFAWMPEIQHLLDPCLRFTRITKKEDGDMAETFDISVEGTHEYLANGVVVHNTLKVDTSKHSLADFRKIVLENQPTIRCCSIMPCKPDHEMGYEYTPESEVSEEELKAIESRVNGHISHTAAHAIDMDHLRCEGGVCPI